MSPKSRACRVPPNGCEEVPAMLSRLLEAHELILVDAHDAARRTAELGDDGTNDLIVSDVIRTNELQAWFLVEHLVDTPLVRAVTGRTKPAAGIPVAGLQALRCRRSESKRAHGWLVGDRPIVARARPDTSSAAPNTACAIPPSASSPLRCARRA